MRRTKECSCRRRGFRDGLHALPPGAFDDYAFRKVRFVYRLPIGADYRVPTVQCLISRHLSIARVRSSPKRARPTDSTSFFGACVSFTKHSNIRVRNNVYDDFHAPDVTREWCRPPGPRRTHAPAVDVMPVKVKWKSVGAAVLALTVQLAAGMFVQRHCNHLHPKPDEVAFLFYFYV